MMTPKAITMVINFVCDEPKCTKYHPGDVQMHSTDSPTIFALQTPTKGNPEAVTVCAIVTCRHCLRNIEVAI
jgi:hypothetical protein